MSYRTLLVSTALSAVMATAANAHFIGVGGNNSIDGSLCVGGDCVAEEAFGFDTIRLKENNLRINFADTSVAASFPTTDWRIIINDSANGGASYFGIEDSSAGNIPFRVSANARNNALFVDSQGDVGIGTSTPAVDLEIKIGDSPTVRLQQDGSSGFQPQTWDMAGNETNFFIRDASNGSVLPFRIRPGAPTNSLMIDEDGNIGLGTASPAAEADLHIEGGARAEIHMGDDAGADVELEKNDGVFNVSFAGTGDSELRIHEADGNVEVRRGDLIVLNGGLISTGGGGACTAADPCDAVFDPAIYTVPSIEEHATAMWQNKHLPAVGPTGPGLPIDVTEKMLRMLNELEHAHIYIEQLNARVAELEEALVVLK